MASPQSNAPKAAIISVAQSQDATSPDGRRVRAEAHHDRPPGHRVVDGAKAARFLVTPGGFLADFGRTSLWSYRGRSRDPKIITPIVDASGADPQMDRVNIRTFDLNLLPVFRAIFETHSVSNAAKAVGLSQPAVSNALSRLRAQYGNPLFERMGGRMEPTDRAREIAPVIVGALDGIVTTLQGRFDPAHLSRTFKIDWSAIVASTCSRL